MDGSVNKTPYKLYIQLVSHKIYIFKVSWLFRALPFISTGSDKSKTAFISTSIYGQYSMNFGDNTYFYTWHFNSAWSGVTEINFRACVTYRLFSLRCQNGLIAILLPLNQCLHRPHKGYPEAPQCVYIRVIHFFSKLKNEKRISYNSIFNFHFFPKLEKWKMNLVFVNFIF